MWIYVIEEDDTFTEHTHIHSAYVSEEIAKQKVIELNKQQEVKNIRYLEWVENDCDEEMPDTGDYHYTYKKVWLDETL